ncbi:MAG: O-antigen ligase family protein, partial [Bacteroidales bacterium]|nr:O-antigen ligase family protein [Bacteroidales bacterium]
MKDPRIGTAYGRSVFHIDLLLCLTAFFSFLSVELPLGGFGNIRLPAELLLGLLCLLFLFVLWGQRRFKADLGLMRPDGFWPCELRWWIGAYLLWMWIGVFFSPCPQVAFKASFTYTACVVPAFYAAYKMERETGDGGFGRRVVWAALLGLGLFSLVALGRYYFGEPVSYIAIFRVTQPFLADHTHWGAMVTLWLFPALYFVRHAARPWQRVGAAVLVAVFLWSLWVSHARAATASLLVPLAIVGVLYVWRWPRRWRLVTLAVALVAVTAGGVWLVRQGQAQQARKSAHWGEHMLSLVQYRQDASSMERVNRWKCAARLTADYPWFGCGKDVYPFVYGPYQREEDLTEESTFAGDRGNAHSEYISAVCETGIPGGVLFLCIVVFGFTAGVKAYRAAGRGSDGKDADGFR